MSEQLALDILKIVLPVVSLIIAWQQKQIADNRRYIEKLLDRCFEDDEETPKKHPLE
jgi:succinylglutamate desuccinylase